MNGKIKMLFSFIAGVFAGFGAWILTRFIKIDGHGTDNGARKSVQDSKKLIANTKSAVRELEQSNERIEQIIAELKKRASEK